MDTDTKLTTWLAVATAVGIAITWAASAASDTSIVEESGVKYPTMTALVCDIDDDISNQWVGLKSAFLSTSGNNMWKITGNTGSVTYYVQRPGEDCAVITYPVETIESSSTRA